MNPLLNFLTKKLIFSFLFKNLLPSIGDKVNATNEDILELHSKDNKPTVLVSPSLTYGVDLKDNLARFQIIVKLPYSPLGSKRVKALFEQDKRWYENKMLVNLIQACGRGTRST